MVEFAISNPIILLVFGGVIVFYTICLPLALAWSHSQNGVEHGNLSRGAEALPMLSWPADDHQHVSNMKETASAEAV